MIQALHNDGVVNLLADHDADLARVAQHVDKDVVGQHIQLLLIVAALVGQAAFWAGMISPLNSGGEEH